MVDVVPSSVYWGSVREEVSAVPLLYSMLRSQILLVGWLSLFLVQFTGIGKSIG